MNPVEWNEAKKQLKFDICNYFYSHNADKNTLQKICEFIKIYGEFHERDFIYDPHDDYISKNFSLPHRQKICEFLKRWENLDKEDKEFIDKQRPECWATDDYDYADWLKTPEGKGEIIVYQYKVTIESFYFIEGFAPPHPSKKRLGKSSGGGYLWEYSRDALPMLERTGIPVLRSMSAIKF